jgi:hypothetical protein
VIEDAYGSRLYAELKRQGGVATVTALLNYAQIQELKAADREDIVRIFGGSSYDFIQRVKRDSPEELAQFMARMLEARQRQAALMMFGLALMAGG